jgi:L-cysteine S-thiosulfotransferase
MAMNKGNLILSASLMLICSVSFAQRSSDRGYAESFKANGIAGLDRLTQDKTQQFCSNPTNLNGRGNPKIKQAIEAANLETIQPPSDGRYWGNWKEGEKIAQSGRGGTWTDKADTVMGGGCYNCHQIDKKEISYGSIGPSLWNYGKIRGNSDAVIQYTWNKISNAKAYNACSNMPRFAHFKLLSESQIKDLMSLLLDPQSPVNQ